MEGPFLSVVVPAYNEAAHLAAAVQDIHEGLVLRREQRRLGRFEIVVVENGSTDATLEVATMLARDLAGVGVESLGRPDYGAALRAGMLVAQGDLVACFDADYYDLDFLDAALEVLTNADVALASKRAFGSIDARPWPRRAVTTIFAGVLRVGFGLGLSDTHGMKVIRREALGELVPACRFDADIFDTELVVRAVRTDRRVVELPVVVTERRPPRTSIWRRAPRAVIGLVRLRLRLAAEARRRR